ncbi:hypothetical protein I9W82_005655 [Candida metapsilosis]|uniref:Uncharacterized protein n=1 Tax=Candida metapsilosis TaxID=273372 RepID=A0A8H8DAF2_9ASCO|nr:hypothetical protein I9W82_005655 [Candida metapsilosis]
MNDNLFKRDPQDDPFLNCSIFDGASTTNFIFSIIIGYLTTTTVLFSIANVNGLLSAALTVVKYVPQIYTTYTLKHPGTLSIGMMCIQTPGGFVFAATLIFTKGSHWSSWVSYLVAACLQGTLLSLCIYYEYIVGNNTAEELEREEVERIEEENRQATDASEENRLLEQQ